MNLNCDVVQDLAALYHDGLASVSSERGVRAHLEECETCRDYYKKYGTTAPIFPRLEEESEAEYRFLAKRMRTRRLWTFVGVLAYVSASLCTVILLWMRARAEGVGVSKH